MSPMPHLDHEQRRTLEALSSHPLPHNLEWPQVLALLRAMGDEFEEREGRVRVKFNGHTEVFHTPRHKDVPAEMVVKLRHFLVPTATEQRPEQSG